MKNNGWRALSSSHFHTACMIMQIQNPVRSKSVRKVWNQVSKLPLTCLRNPSIDKTVCLTHAHTKAQSPNSEIFFYEIFG